MFASSGEKASNSKEAGGANKGENVWAQVLKESSKRTHLLDEKNVLLLGERNSGKSSIISRLQGTEPTDTGTSDGLALDYTYLDIYSPTHSDELLGRASIWSLEGDAAHAQMLDFGLNEETFDKTIALIVLDLSHPWTLEETLEKWLKVLSDHIEALKSKLGKGVFESLQKQSIIHFQQYRDPTTSKASADPASHALVSLHSTPATPSDIEVEDLPTLGESVLTHNVGVPIVVVCNKADSVAMLEKEYSYRDDTFVYIQQHLRRICLKYGAGLIYVSAKRNSNCDVLKNYLMHRMYSFDFTVPAQIVDKDVIFVPSGWDSLSKIEIEFANQKICNDASIPYSEVIKRLPIHQVQKSLYTEGDVAEDDQEFLARQLKNIEKAEQQAATATVLTTGSPIPSHTPTSEPTTPYAPPDKTVRRPAGEKSTPLSAHLAGAAAGSPRTAAREATSSGAGVPGTPSKNSEHKVLSDFFTSLLNKDPRKGSATPSASGTSRPAAARPAATPSQQPPQQQQPATTTTPTTTATPPPTTENDSTEI